MTKRGKNQGYTLVEMIVVIAIIAVVAGLSFISVTLIHSAKAKNASTTVDSEVSTLITKSKNMLVSRPKSEILGIEYKNEKGESDRWQVAARIYADERGAYYFQRGYYNIDKQWYDFENTDPEGDGKGIALSSYVVVKFSSDHYYFVSYDAANKRWKEDAVGEGYTGLSVDDQDVKTLNSNGAGAVKGGLFIRFSKNGTCEAGAGDIRFYKRNGNLVAHEYIRANGSHQCK